MTKIRVEAISEKIPSHNSSDFFHRSEALVNQTAINAAPIASASNKPMAEPMKIYNAERGERGQRANGFDWESGTRHTWTRNFLKSFFCSPSSLEALSLSSDGSEGGSSEPLSGLCLSFSDSAAGRDSTPNRVWAICSTIPSKTEMMMAASRVSLNTMKKIGTENTFGMAASRTSRGQTTKPEEGGSFGAGEKGRTTGEPGGRSGSMYNVVCMASQRSRLLSDKTKLSDKERKF